ncbi:MAG: hypothetical protein AABZ47_17040 [Planctomycetota bacterium]
MGTLRRLTNRHAFCLFSVATLVLVSNEAYSDCGDAQLNLVADICQTQGDEFVATIRMTNVPVQVAGGQFFIEFSQTGLEVLSLEAGDPPFIALLFGSACPITELCTPGRIEMAVGILPGTQATRMDLIIGRIHFRVISSLPAPFIRFIRTNPIPARLSTPTGIPIPVNLVDFESFSVDLHDFSDFQTCFSSDGEPAFENCRCAFDSDGDDDVDQVDFLAYFSVLNGPQFQSCVP